MGVGDHRVSRNDNATLPCKLNSGRGGNVFTVKWLVCGPYLLLLVGCEHGDLTVCHIRPQHELLFPLHHRHTADQRQSDKPNCHGNRHVTHEDVHNTRQDFLIVHAAVIPTRVFPAPQGRTMMPDRARLQNEVGK